MACKIYWYPLDGNGSESATKKEISFSQSVVADLSDYPIRDVQNEWPPDDSPKTLNQGAKVGVTLKLKLTESATADLDLYCALRTLETHLLLGGRIGFTFDHNYSGAWPVVNGLGTAYAMPALGDDSGSYGTEITGFETSPTPHATDTDTEVCVFETEGPEFMANYTRITSWAAGQWEIPQLPNGYGILINSSQTKCIIRNRRFFWPLYLADSSRGKELAFRKTVSAAYYEMELDFVYCPRELFDALGETP